MLSADDEHKKGFFETKIIAREKTEKTRPSNNIRTKKTSGEILEIIAWT